MNIGDLIQAGMLFVAIIGLFYSWYADHRQRRYMLYSEYTKRYQDFFMKIPDEVYEGVASLDVNTIRYIRIYFDLCSEEYHLMKAKEITEDVWTLWVEGMQTALANDIYVEAWEKLKYEYNTDFRTYFEENVVNKAVRQVPHNECKQ